jgi:hypothetical protein
VGVVRGRRSVLGPPIRLRWHRQASVVGALQLVVGAKLAH